MTDRTDKLIRDELLAGVRKDLEEGTAPIIDQDRLVLLTRNGVRDHLKFHVLPNFPPGVLEHALRCPDCNKILTRDGRAFVPSEIIREVGGEWFYRIGGYNVLGWTENGLAKYEYGTGRGFKTATVPADELCCIDCGEIPENKLQPNQSLLSKKCRSRWDGESVNVKDILPDDFERDELNIEIPPYAFIPDQWSRAFLRGLSKINIDGKKCLEVGVGTGINVIYLLAKFPEFIAISDKEGRCTSLACRNIGRNVPEDQLVKVLPYGGSLDLVDWARFAEHSNFDLVYGCLPQVVLPEGKRIWEGDALAHYYERDRYASDFGVYGLALNDLFLQQVHSRLNEGGSVVLNLGGRPSQATLEQLFRKNRFNPELLHQEVIAQHADTSLESLVTLEVATGRKFEFFDDEDANNLIPAVQAEARRRAGLPVFHRIYIYQGRKIS